MHTLKYFFHWVALHLLVFFFSPFSFMLAGLVVEALVSIEPYVFGVRSPISSRLQPLYNQALYLLGPLVTGIILGALTGWLQSTPMRKLSSDLAPVRWIALGALGMGLAFLAFAWAYSTPSLANPLPVASTFSASVYGLAAALPQSRSLRKQLENTWGWFLFTTLAGILSFALICAPVWVAEIKAYFWIIFLLCAAGGVIFGLLTGVQYIGWTSLWQGTKITSIDPESRLPASKSDV